MTTPSLNDYLNEFKGRDLTIVREKTWGKTHEIYAEAPCQWSRLQGATHTLFCGVGHGRGTRPAKLLKTRLYVGNDEDEHGAIVWEKWTIKTETFWPNR